MADPQNITIKLNVSGDAQLVTNSDGGIDLDLVSDHGSLEQAMRVHLMTRLGEDVISPYIGLPIEDIIGIFNSHHLQGTIRRTLNKDPRVEGVDVIIADHDRAKRIVTLDVRVAVTGGRTILTPLTVEA